MADEMRPKLRPVQARPSDQFGQAMVVLSDPLGISEHAVALPANVVPLLELCDGTRDLPALRTALELRTGMKMGPEYLDRLVAALDEALLLDSERFARAYDEALRAYRAAPCRQPILAGGVYDLDPASLERALQGYFDGLSGGDVQGRDETIRALVCPHIDYQRGGPVYAQVWQRARRAAGSAEVAVVLGTNHFSGRQLFTLTRQSYATPFGILRTAKDVVDSVASALGEAVVFVEELNHRNEHSIEAAVVWLHYLARNGELELVPILCGSFERFLQGDGDPAADEEIAVLVRTIREATSGRRTLVVAAADLAHVGPAFGDSHIMGAAERAKLSQADGELTAAIASGDAEAVFQQVRQDMDRRRICGLSPIYLALRILGETTGEITGYAQCPADHQDTSLVSICGVVFQ